LHEYYNFLHDLSNKTHCHFREIKHIFLKEHASISINQAHNLNHRKGYKNKINNVYLFVISLSMAVIKPFKGIRPTKDKVHLVASRPIEEYNTQQLYAKLASNPYSFLHVIKPDFEDEVRAKPNSIELHQKVKNKYQQFLQEGVLMTDAEESFYIYQQISGGHPFTGIIACASIWDYFKDIIKIHEHTISDREENLKNYLGACNFNAEPICLCYPDNEQLKDIILSATTDEPTYDFSTTDKIEHKLWKVSNSKKINEITSAFAQISAIYIADGHHRTSASALLSKALKEKNKNHTGNEPYNFLLAAFFPESDLKIYEFNRIIKDLNFLSKETLLRKLSIHFHIVEKGITPYTPAKKREFSMYLEEHWYSLTLKEEHGNKLDAELLTELILSPLLDIHDLKTDKRVLFVSGKKGIEELKKTIDSGKASVGFGLYSVTIKDIIKVADNKGFMPPKTTWVEPKLRSGLIVYSLTSS
jgi:uncharacterized protein (DUF1015 family)